ncbi:MAG TPA: hypothetical protein VMS65_04880 [Polyangiaceae bacterium]|nr:hypothetical protein [Polyangiaceae bacterium]
MKAHARRAIALLSLLSAIACVLFAGKSYLVCPWMQKSVPACCCPVERPNTDGPAISRAPCCERKTFAAAPSVPTDSTRPTMTGPAANVFPGELVRIASRVPESLAPPNTVRERGARAGPDAELFELHSSYLI